MSKLKPPRGYKSLYEVARLHPRSRIRKKYLSYWRKQVRQVWTMDAMGGVLTSEKLSRAYLRMAQPKYTFVPMHGTPITLDHLKPPQEFTDSYTFPKTRAFPDEKSGDTEKGVSYEA